MSNNDLQGLMELNCEDRFDYCITKVVEEKELWILVNKDEQFLKIYAEEDDFEYLPIWPTADLAQAYAKGTQDLQARSISLPEFLKKWVSGLSRDGLEIGVFPGMDAEVWITGASEFKSDLQDGLSHF